MRSYIIAALATVALAAPEPLFGLKVGVGRGGKCMTDSQAQQVATNFADLIATYSDALANETLTVDFTDYSSSVNTLIDSGCTTPQPVSIFGCSLKDQVY
jgi:hypothetical protein